MWRCFLQASIAPIQIVQREQARLAGEHTFAESFNCLKRFNSFIVTGHLLLLVSFAKLQTFQLHVRRGCSCRGMSSHRNRIYLSISRRFLHEIIIEDLCDRSLIFPTNRAGHGLRLKQFPLILLAQNIRGSFDFWIFISFRFFLIVQLYVIPVHEIFHLVF